MIHSIAMDHHVVPVAAMPGRLLRRANMRMPGLSTVVRWKSRRLLSEASAEGDDVPACAGDRDVGRQACSSVQGGAPESL